jgi:hypothetical protein
MQYMKLLSVVILTMGSYVLLIMNYIYTTNNLWTKYPWLLWFSETTNYPWKKKIQEEPMRQINHGCYVYSKLDVRMLCLISTHNKQKCMWECLADQDMYLYNVGFNINSMFEDHTNGHQLQVFDPMTCNTKYICTKPWFSILSYLIDYDALHFLQMVQSWFKAMVKRNSLYCIFLFSIWGWH